MPFVKLNSISGAVLCMWGSDTDSTVLYIGYIYQFGYILIVNAVLIIK